MRYETESESSSVGLEVGAAERRVVVVIDEERHIAQTQRLCASGEGHQYDGHQHCQHNQQLVPAEQHEFLPGLSEDFLHRGISDLRDSISEIKTSSSENSTGLSAAIRTPASRKTVPASRFCSSFCTTTCRRSPNKETREAPNFFFNAPRARSG